MLTFGGGSDLRAGAGEVTIVWRASCFGAGIVTAACCCSIRVSAIITEAGLRIDAGERSEKTGSSFWRIVSGAERDDAGVRSSMTALSSLDEASGAGAVERRMSG